MSDLANRAGASSEGAFRLRTVAILLAVGILGFLGTLVLSAYAPDLRSGDNGGGHALSNSAVGYSGIVQLAEATGRHPQIVRDDHRYDSDNLLVLTPEHGATDVSKPLAVRLNKPTLVVLPKWDTEGDGDHQGWVRYSGLLSRYDPEGVLSPAAVLHLRRHRSGGRPLVVSPELAGVGALVAPRPLQVITGATPHVEKTDYGSRTTGTIVPLITDDAGGIVLGRIDNRPEYVLADPDLLSNQGLTSETQAAGVLAMLDWLNRATPDTTTRSPPTGIDFDVTLDGLGRSPNPLKLAFEPPFLAATLAIAAALLMAGLHATGRFGAARPRERAIAFGKAALVDNAAALVKKARREGAMGARYAAVVRERARIVFGVPVRIQGEALDAALDRLPGRTPFTGLAAQAAGAQHPADMLAAAQALRDWQGKTE